MEGLDKKQFEDIATTIENIKEEYNGNKEVEIRFGDKHLMPNQGFKCVLPLDMYNETSYEYIKELAAEYHVSSKENEEKNNVFLYFFINNQLVATHEFYYDQEMISELNGPMKK